MADVHTNSPTRQLAQHLEGISFPARRDKLIEHARQKGADSDLIDKLNQMPDEEYTSMADVFKGFGMGESGSGG